MKLDDVSREVLFAIAAIALLYALSVTVRGWIQRRRRRGRFARAAEGEREAIALLEERGFTIEGAQVGGTYVLEVDGSAIEVRVTADYIVRRARDRFVAEVKTGRFAPRIETAATRRQLLEYEHAFDVAGLLLVDADARTVRRVEFRRSSRKRRWGAWAAVAIVLSVLALATSFGGDGDGAGDDASPSSAAEEPRGAASRTIHGLRRMRGARDP